MKSGPRCRLVKQAILDIASGKKKHLSNLHDLGHCGSITLPDLGQYSLLSILFLLYIMEVTNLK